MQTVPDPITGHPVPPCTAKAAAVCQDAADICLNAADLAQRGLAQGSGDEAASALGIDESSPAYHIAFHAFLAKMVQMRDDGRIKDPEAGGAVSPEEARDCYLEAALALQLYAFTASAN